MSRQGRYWIFFVIVAVGLALSWAQIGDKTREAFEAEPVHYLATETPCAPLRWPCAAVAEDRALVLGPDAGRLLLRQTGFDVGRIVRVESMMLTSDGSAGTPTAADRSTKGWVLTGSDKASGILRIRVLANDGVTVAEFPLQR